MDSKEKVKQKSTKSRLQKRVRILAVITSLSVIITFTTIITSIVICLYYKKQSSELEVFCAETPTTPSSWTAFWSSPVYSGNTSN